MTIQPTTLPADLTTIPAEPETAPADLQTAPADLTTTPANQEKPRYLLFSQARRSQPPTAASEGAGGWWHFLLESLEGAERLEAGDFEPRWGGERLELLAVVRGLEALDQPSQVTLVTPSRYVQRGLRYGLSPWRENHWRWERFGELTPVKNADLWQRVDRALEFHVVECRVWRLDRASQSPAGEAGGGASAVPRPHFGRRGSRAARGALIAAGAAD